MNVVKSDRGFGFIAHPGYLYPHGLKRLVSESSAIGEYDDSFDRPGSSFLWVGGDHHLNREEVAELVAALARWVETGRLSIAASTEGGK